MSPSHAAVHPGAPSRPARLRLLLADDTPTVRYFLRYAFEASSAFEVVAEAGDGEEAVEMAERYRPDVVLLDLAMPVMDGLQAIPLIRERAPETKIIIHSGFEATRMEAQALALGAAAYLEKSHRPDVLVDRVLAVMRDVPPGPRRVPGPPAPAASVSKTPPAAPDLNEATPQALDLAFDRAPVGMALLGQDGRWLRVNRALGEMLGRPEPLVPGDELLRGTIAEVIHPDDRESVTEALRGLLDGELAGWEADRRCLHGKGRLVWGHVELTLVRDPDGSPRYFVALVQDISERHLADEKARLCQSLAQAIGSAADLEEALGVLLAQLCEVTGWACAQAWVPVLSDDGVGDGSRLVASRAWHARIPGLDDFRRDSTGRTFVPGLGLPGRVWVSGEPAWIDDVTDEPNFPRAIPAATAGLRSAAAVPVVAGERVVAVIEFFCTEARPEDAGLLRLVGEVAAEVGGFLERKRVEDALRASEQRYRAVAEVAPEAVIGADGQGRIVAWNPGATTTFGYEADEVLGRPLSILMPERFRSDHQRGLERFRLGGEARVVGRTVEVAGLRKDGTEFPIELSLGVWRSGAEMFFSGIIRDVSERKRAEQALAAARDEAMQAALQKSQFLATVSHEIRTPLGAVVAMTGLLSATARDAEQADWIRTANRSATTAMEIINDILDFSKVEAGHLLLEHRAFDLREVVDDAAAMVRLEAGRKGLDLVVTVDPVFPATCVGDPGRLRQVLINLLANAVRFTDSGSVTVRVPAPVLSDEMMTVRLEVADTGIGISPEHQDQLFEPFTQGLTAAARRPGGTGLGLAICRQLVTIMGGSIGVESGPDAGSTFWCEVNLRREIAPESAVERRVADQKRVDSSTTPPPAAPAPSPADQFGEGIRLPGRARVLVVEDDETSQKVAAVLLRRLGFDVEVTGSGQEALARLEQAAFDTVFMDCFMPGLDGFATTARIREREAACPPSSRRRTPIVAMTGAAMPGDRERCLAAGMDDYVCKPVTPEELERVVKRWSEKETPPKMFTSWGRRAAGDVGETTSIDWERLNLLRAACAYDTKPGVLGELVGEYLAAGAERIDGLRAAVATGDRTRVEHLAHMLKGSSATFGAVEVAGLSADLEQAAHVGSLRAAPEFLAGLSEAFDRASRALRQSLHTEAV